MKEELRKAVIAKYIDIVEGNILDGNYAETDFRHYSELVRSLVDKARGARDPIFFTALCIPPFKWFNFNIDEPNVVSVSEVGKMEADPTWIEYIKFSRSLADANTNIHRCVFGAEDGFAERPLFKDLVEASKIEAQFEANIIVRIPDDLSPLRKEEIETILGKRMDSTYKCYKDALSAYLIINNGDILNFDSALYEQKRLRDHFASFQPTGHLETWTYARKIGISLSDPLPEDFFLIGSGQHPKKAKWHFALAADVTKDLKKVRLWFITEDYPAMEKGADGHYFTRFKFQSLINFVNRVVLK